VLISNISIMAGGKKLYDALTEAGRVATQGIYFDSGSDRLRPESTPTLKEIGDMLKEHAELKLTIEGHTDNVGNAAANKTLAEQRAAAVKAFLVGSYGIDASRLQTAGFGDQKPIAPEHHRRGPTAEPARRTRQELTHRGARVLHPCTSCTTLRPVFIRFIFGGGLHAGDTGNGRPPWLRDHVPSRQLVGGAAGCVSRSFSLYRLCNVGGVSGRALSLRSVSVAVLRARAVG
jgi:hypothetical protein